jgi:hypothetical protein
MKFIRKYIRVYDSKKKKKVKQLAFYINNNKVSRNTFLKELGESKRSTFLCESKNGNFYYKLISKYEHKEINVLTPQNIRYLEKEGIEFFEKQVQKGKMMVIRKFVQISILEDRQIIDVAIEELNNEVLDLIEKAKKEFKIINNENLYVRPALTFSAIIQKQVYSVKSKFTYSTEGATPTENIDKKINEILEKVFQKSSILALGVIAITLFIMETDYYANLNKSKN